MRIDSPQWILGRAARIPGEPGWERKAEMAGLWPFRLHDTLMASCRIGCVMIARRFDVAFVLLICGTLTWAQAPSQKPLWKSVGFAIVKFNDEAPKSWNIYHTEKKGLLLVRLWKRYLLVDMKEQEAYEIDPQTVKQRGEDVEWSPADKPDQPLETPEWKTRDVGSMQLVKFRLGKDGHILELQIPLLINGKPAY
jgi:hypothetical protein